MRLNAKALDALAWAKDKQIVPDDLTEIEIIRIVYDQEIVTWCSEDGCVSFDTDDVEHLD